MITNIRWLQNNDINFQDVTTPIMTDSKPSSEELALNEDELKHLGLQKDGDTKTDTKVEDEEWEAELARELQVHTFF